MSTRQEQSVHANGIDIHYVQTGAGEPLLLLQNGMISTNPIWAEWPSSYENHLDTLAEYFLVIVPDLRGSGRTGHTGGPISYTLLADDAIAMIAALGLDRPFICGYGEGGTVATIVGVRAPESVRAIVNHGGDLFNADPQAPALVLTRQMLGGGSDAARADADLVASSPFLGVMVELMRADHDAAQGSGHWRTVLNRTFDRVSQPSTYTTADLRTISAPTLILVGDRDQFLTVEESAAAYRGLPDGELAVLPNTPIGVNPAAVQTMIEFFRRRQGALAPTPVG